MCSGSSAGQHHDRQAQRHDLDEHLASVQYGVTFARSRPVMETACSDTNEEGEQDADAEDQCDDTEREFHGPSYLSGGPGSWHAALSPTHHVMCVRSAEAVPTLRLSVPCQGFFGLLLLPVALPFKHPERSRMPGRLSFPPFHRLRFSPNWSIS